MAWLVLFCAGLVEVAWAVGLRYTAGFTRPWPSAVTVAGGLASFFLLAQAGRRLPICTAYAVWTGSGVVGPAIFGMVLFDEPRNWVRLRCIGMVGIGVIGLKLAPGR
ncbi:MAG: multidrug efflux SMR transporter [Thermoanaerobaculaceae bacterium]|jgi:quaternary ammonium compound-resistance protein SugE